MILSISVPVLDAIYPISITLIVLGLCDTWLKHNPYVYPFTIGAVGIISVIYALENLGVTFGFVNKLCHSLPLYSLGLGWVMVAVITAALCCLIGLLVKAGDGQTASAAD